MEDLKEANDEMMRLFWENKRVKVIEELSGKGVEATKKFWSFVAAKHCKPTVFDRVERAGSEELVPEEAEVKTEVENFLKDLFHGQFTPFDKEEEDPQEGGEEEVDKDLDEEFKIEEVKEIIKTLKNNKAMGVDNIPAEVLKNASGRCVGMITELFNMIRREGRVPHTWKTGRVVMVYKSGAKTDLANYRPLTVICAFSALFSKVLAARLGRVVEQKRLLGEIQQ